MRRLPIAIVAVDIATFVVASFLSTPPARAFEELSGTVPLGMGGASRAWAVGDAGPLLNPSGMSLTKAYTLEGAYEYASRLSDDFFHASVVDSTSTYNLAGGLTYTYHSANRGGGVSASGHEVGLALSFPFAEYVSVGGTLKYFKLEGADDVGGKDGGITFDLGITVRPTPALSLALVGSNLRPLDSGQAPQGVGYGVALLPLPSLVLALDGLTRLTADDQTGRKGTSIMGGGSFTIAERFAVRAGGGYDAATGNGYATVGFSGISEIGAIDLGLREDLTRAEASPGVERPRETVAGVSLRLFIPATQTDSLPQ